MAIINWQFYPGVAHHLAMRAFVEALAKRQKAPKTIDAYARNLEDLLRTWPDAPPERVVEADAAEIDVYIDRLYARGPARPGGSVAHPTGRGLADATIQQRLVTTRLFYDFCLQRQLRQNPTNPVPRGSRHGAHPVPGPVRRRRRLPWIPSDDQWRAIVADLFAHESLRNRALVVLAYDAALRRQELLGLHLSDVDWALGLVQVRAQLAKSGAARQVPVAPATEAQLETVQIRGRLAAIGRRRRRNGLTPRSHRSEFSDHAEPLMRP